MAIHSDHSSTPKRIPRPQLGRPPGFSLLLSFGLGSGPVLQGLQVALKSIQGWMCPSADNSALSTAKLDVQ